MNNFMDSLKWYQYFPLRTQVQHPEWGAGEVAQIVSPREREVCFTFEEVIHAYDLSEEQLRELAFDVGADPATLVTVTERKSVQKSFDIDELSQWVVAK